MPAFAYSAFGCYFVHASTFSSTQIAWSLPCKSNAKKLVTGCWIVLIRPKSVRDCDVCKTHGMSTRCLICFTLFDIQDANSAWSQIQRFGSCSLCLKPQDSFVFSQLAGGLAKAVKAGTVTGTYRTSTSTFAATNRMGKIQDPWWTSLLPQWNHQPHCHSAMFVETSLTCSNLHLLITRWGLFVAESNFSWPVLVVAAWSYSSWAIGSGPQFWQQ